MAAARPPAGAEDAGVGVAGKGGTPVFGLSSPSPLSSFTRGRASHPPWAGSEEVALTEVASLEVAPAGCTSAQTPRPVQDLTLELCHGARRGWQRVLLLVGSTLPSCAPLSCCGCSSGCLCGSLAPIVCFALLRGAALPHPGRAHGTGSGLRGVFSGKRGCLPKGGFSCPVAFCPPRSPEIRCCWKRALCPGFLPS